MATDRVSIGQMADAIMEGLEEYASLATDDLKASVRKAGKTVKDEIAATALRFHLRSDFPIFCHSKQKELSLR